MDNFFLRDYQQDMKSRLFEAWKSHRSVMVQMPTGTGKTHVLAAVIREFLQDNAQAEVWIVAHRRELVAQIEDTVAKYGIRNDDNTVKAMSIQWLQRHWEEVEGCPSLIVIDEAHHALAESYQDLWRHYPNARKLGMTATPCRMNRRGFTDLFDVLLTSWSIAEFIRKEQLVPFDYVAIRPDSEEQRVIDSLEKRGADGDYQLKEMNAVLNRHTSIGRLYRSMERFAHGKKGIVYAISIDHARNIAAYYNNKGIETVAIDSRTQAVERRLWVDDFKGGKIRVLVNVDVFSEGFDCPDVEFVQMARPTLSLAKYLQQVGRGLRRSEGKDACMLIDNVGLYRVFGLPTVAWDWEAMFRGLSSGKGHFVRPSRRLVSSTTVSQEEGTEALETIISHDRLLESLCAQESQPASLQSQGTSMLKSWQDGESGLWGLKRGRVRMTDACYVRVFDIRYDMAAVRFGDMSCGVVDGAGEVLWRKNRCASMKFVRDRFLSVRMQNGQELYVDLYNMRVYDRKPEVKRFGNIGLLKVGRAYYSRTKTVYVNDQGIDDSYITLRGFCLTVYDFKVPVPGGTEDRPSYGCRSGYACLLENDYDSFYWVYRWLSDGSIVVRDGDGRYFHAGKGRKKVYVGCDGARFPGDSADAGTYFQSHGLT